MNNIVAVNKKVIQYEIDVEHIIISISDDKKFFPPIMKHNLVGLLRLEFFDYDDHQLKILFSEGEPIPENKIFNIDHAKQILDFVFSNIEKVDLIITQCDCGVSRSSGTAGALSLIINNTDEIFFKPPYIPNRLVYRTILNQYFENKEYYRNKYNLNFPDYFQ